ncbi:serine acetyltransferase [Polaromonas sp. JS666]|uniref:serine acetyltransferase n=1 Tax=Polaromonas sp. (strain JS666 / ATCC BAA-500) TaxID=296591 RepID=UPI00004645A2|nr:serine acetyltransferase [Polaromonas sp. JS666]ABE43815.1 serine O-acetyltransferase [Polaromonas sp. JS666]
MHALKADTYREFGRFSGWLVLKGVVLHPAFRVVVTLRCCQAADHYAVPLRWLLLTLARLLHRLASQLAGIELPWRTSVAPGLALTHGRGIVVNAGARIGSNVTLFHGVTLGQRDHIDDDGRRFTTYPVIEDEVWIGPHAIVVGGVTIGRGSRIAGGAYVYESIPPYSMVLGNPGNIVKSNCTPDVDNRFVA